MANNIIQFCCILGLTFLGGCAIHPEGESAERERAELTMTGSAAELPEKPTLEDYLQYAFFHNTDLQARYWQWQAAIEQIPQDASPPNLALGFEYMFSTENMKTWDRTTLDISNDPMSNIPFPSKLTTAGIRALENARAAGLRFQEAKFLLQGKVYSTYFDLALLAESIRLNEEKLALLGFVQKQAEISTQIGSANQQTLLTAQTELDLAKNSLANLKSQVIPTKARFNALLGRQATDPVVTPESLPSPRPLLIADDKLIALAAERNPELQALAEDIAGEKEALSLAEQAYIPDFSLRFGFSGSLSQTIGAMITLPVRIEAIQAGIKQAQANIKIAEAAKTQYEQNLAASFILNLSLLRNSERQIELFEKTIIPRTHQTIEIAHTAYAAGQIDFSELLNSQRMYIDSKLLLAQLKMEREKALAAIETWSAVDVEAMSKPEPMNSFASSVKATPKNTANSKSRSTSSGGM